MPPGKLVANLKRLGVRDSIIDNYLSALPGRPGQEPRITPAFTNAQREIAKLLVIRRSHQFGWAPLPRGHDTDAVLCAPDPASC